MTTNLVNFDPTKFLLAGEDVKRSFEKSWLMSLFAKHKDLPQSDVIQFLHKAQLTGANPMLDQIFLIERKVCVKEYGQPDRWEKRGTIVFSYQFLNAKANETGEFQGYKISTGPKERFNPFNPEQSKKELCSTCTVTRKGFEFTYDAWWSEYAQDNSQWKNKPYLMLEKCAFAGSLRRAFPEALSGIYIEDEIREEDIDAEFERRRKAEAVETTANKVLENAEKLEEKLKSPDLTEKISAVIEVIKGDMAELTKGLDLQAKGKAMTENLGVNKFQELSSKSLEELELKQKEIRQILEEKRSRASQTSNEGASTVVKEKTTKEKKNDKPTFTLGGEGEAK